MLAQVSSGLVDSDRMRSPSSARGRGGPADAWHWIASLAIASTSALAVAGVALTSMEPERPEFTEPAVQLDSSALEAADQLLSLPGSTIDEVGYQSAATLAGYFLAAGTSDDAGWTIDFVDSGAVASVAVERAMLGGYERQQPLERRSALVVAGSGAVPTITSERPDVERVAALAAVTEVSGSVDGLLARVPTANSAVVLELAQSLGLEPRVVADGEADQLVLDRVSDRVIVASWPFACVDRVPLVGARGCSGPGSPLAFVDDATDRPEGRSIDGWVAATTGPLDRSDPHWLSPEEGGVRWTNQEAQQYRDEAVQRTATGFTLTASPNAEPRIDRTPFDSGMVISQATFGWGRVEVDVRLPIGTGLWPAVWLLDAQACSAPGVCEGYETPAYHEIDLIETSGDTDVSTSVHWYQDRIRSLSTTAERPSIGDGEIHTIALDRRPGLLVWSLDGVEIDRVSGPAAADAGPHRAAPMRLIVNLAVGGTFAGDRELGRTSPWWGSSVVPSSYPNLDWTSARVDLVAARFVSLDELVLG